MKKIGSMLLALALMMTMLPLTSLDAYAASKPAKVKGVTQVSAGTGQIGLKWKKASGAKKYQVYVSTNGKKFSKKKTTKSKSCTITNLTPNRKYYIKVRAVKGKKKGKFSAVKQFKTGAATSSGSIVTITPPVGRSFKAFIPSGFKYDRTMTYTGSSAVMYRTSDYKREIQFKQDSAEVYASLSGETKTYNGITGLEYYSPVSKAYKTFAYVDGNVMYRVEVTDFASYDGNDLLHKVLSGLSW